MTMLAWYLLAGLVIVTAAAAVAAAVSYRLGKRDGLEEKTWLDELPPVELAEPLLTPLDLTDTTDRLIHEARLEQTR